MNRLKTTATLLLKLRTFADALDGAVARDRSGLEKHESILNSFGYYVDGVCDAFGFYFFVKGCELYLNGKPKHRLQSVLIVSAFGVNSVLVKLLHFTGNNNKEK